MLWVQASQDSSLSSLQEVYSENGKSVAPHQWMLFEPSVLHLGLQSKHLFNFFFSSLLNLMQDHHCIWINNCVGYWNYKAFFVFILYATIASVYSMVCFRFRVHLFCNGQDSYLT